MNEKCLNALRLKQNKIPCEKIYDPNFYMNRIQTRYLGFKTLIHLMHQPLTLDL